MSSPIGPYAPFYSGGWHNVEEPNLTTPIDKEALNYWDDWLGTVVDSVDGIIAGAAGIVVTPEMFADATHTDDVSQFNAAMAYIAPTGGVIQLKPGKTYNWTSSPAVFDASATGKQHVIIAWGAVINCNVAGVSWTLKKTLTGASFKAIAVLGGEWSNTHASATDFFLMQDIGRTFWFRMNVNVPQGSAWHMSNVVNFSENNHWQEIYDPGSLHTFTTSNDGSTHLSMARTIWRQINVQGGQPGQAKINIGDNTSLYSSVLDGFTGNLATNAIGIRLGGNMHGFVITGNIGLENSVGVTGTDFSYYFTVGTMLGGIPPTCHTAILTVPQEPTMKLMYDGGTGQVTTQPYLYGSLIPYWGVLGVGTEVYDQIPNGSPIALPISGSGVTTVFTITVALPGEYKLNASACVNFTTVSTASQVEMRVNGGTATYTANGKSAAFGRCAADATAANQSVDLGVNCHLTVTAPGTILVVCKPSSVAQAMGVSPLNAYSHVSGYTLLQVA